jgi:hypothetical protein
VTAESIEPVVVGMALYLVAQVVAAIVVGAKMWARLGHVESTTERIDRVVETVRADVVESKTAQASLAAELRAHMADEGRNIDRLEAVIRSTMSRQ